MLLPAADAYPKDRVRSACCAFAGSGHTAVPPSNVMKLAPFFHKRKGMDFPPAWPSKIRLTVLLSRSAY
jgi:hypothetical protein